MPKHILLSIQPKYVREIISGVKKFEFRKKFPDTSNNAISNRIIIYRSKPKMEIMGSFAIKRHLNSDFDSLMKKINADTAYIERISNYFPEKDSCHALEISDLKIYENPLSLNYLRKTYKGFCAGQSYRYLDPLILADIKKKNGEI